ncbi:MAG: flagellar hook-associated protein FlgL [Candidatus Hydrogenedentes bacterium]|nr:flagellar hook-associated protein FlgL [Candidatus Hydrogenedentota bacterium]
MAIVTRITQGMLVQRTLNNLNQQLRRISVLQDQLATGRRVNRPSDNPIDARRAMNLRTIIAKNEQFQANISDASPQLQESASTVLNMVDIMLRALELTTQGANEVVGQSQLDSIALEIDELLEAAVVAGNHRTNNRSIFAGTRTLADAFDVTRVAGQITAVTYAGNDQPIEINISEGVRSEVNVTGSDVFQKNVDIFAVLIGIRDDLLAGDQASLRDVRLAEIATGREQLLSSVAQIGAVQNRLERLQSNLADFNIDFQELLSDKIDADFAETVLGLTVAETALNAALNAAARVLQPSLLDFIR